MSTEPQGSKSVINPALQSLMTEFREFDSVRIRNRANVQWLYTDPGDLGGEWVVTGIVSGPSGSTGGVGERGGDELLILSSGERLIRIPKRDVQKVSAYSTDALLAHLKRTSGYG